MKTVNTHRIWNLVRMNFQALTSWAFFFQIRFKTLFYCAKNKKSIMLRLKYV